MKSHRARAERTSFQTLIICTQTYNSSPHGKRATAKGEGTQPAFATPQLGRRFPVKTAEQGGCTYLTQRTCQAEQEDIVDDAGVAFRKTQELPELSSEQYPWKKDQDEKHE